MTNSTITPAANEREDAYRAWCDYHAMGEGRTIRRLEAHYKSLLAKLYAEQQGIDIPLAEAAVARKIEAVKKSLEGDPYYARQMPPTTRRTTLETWSRTFDWQERLVLIEKSIQDERLAARLAKQGKIIDDDLEDYERELEAYHKLFEATKLHSRRVKQTREREELDPLTGAPVKIREEVTVVEINIDDFLKLFTAREKISQRGRRAAGLPNNISDNKVTNDVNIKRPIQLIFPPGYDDEDDLDNQS